MAGSLLVAFGVFYGSIALAVGTTAFALRFGLESAKMARKAFIATYVLVPPLIAFLCLTALGLAFVMSVIFAAIIFVASLSIGVVLADKTQSILTSTSSNKSSGH